MPKLTEVFLIKEESSKVDLDADEQDLIVRALDVFEKQATAADRDMMEKLLDKMLKRGNPPGGSARGKAAMNKDVAKTNQQLYSKDSRFLKNSKER